MPFVIRGVAKVGEQVNFEACMDIMDICYEKEQTSILFSSPISLAASILACSLIISYFEFPVLISGVLTFFLLRFQFYAGRFICHNNS